MHSDLGGTGLIGTLMVGRSHSLPSMIFDSLHEFLNDGVKFFDGRGWGRYFRWTDRRAVHRLYQEHLQREPQAISAAL